jgi:protoporphyrin/coproporphyrin ferrochelatase
MEGKTGILLLNLGGPATPEGIRPFLIRLFSDREIIKLPGGPLFQPLFARLITRLRLREVMENYAKIGGASPILRLTTAQAKGLEERMVERGHDTVVGIAMRYTSPTSDEALKAMRDAGVTRLVALTLYPHYSKATTGSSLNELRRAVERTGIDLPLKVIDRYPTAAGYLTAVATNAQLCLSEVPEERREKAVVLFSAHSLPKKFIDEGDPYVEEIEASVLGVRERLGLERPWRLSYQSRTGPVEWVGPGTETVIEEMAAEGVRDVVVIPIAFVSDHIETLYEIDMLYGDQARELGIDGYRRSESLNDGPHFLDALADLAEEAIE